MTDAERSARYRQRHPERRKASSLRWYRANKKSSLEQGRRWRAREKQLELDGTLPPTRAAAVARTREKARLRRQRWYADPANKAKFRNYKRDWDRVHGCRNRNLAAATPPWADPKGIIAVYRDAARLTNETGVPHEVDHIVPLKHKLVCGLHVPENLRVLPWFENRRKHNTFEVRP